MARSGRHNIRDLLGPKDRDLKDALDAARAAGQAAAERLVLAGQEEDIVIFKLGKDGQLHIKDYGRTG